MKTISILSLTALFVSAQGLASIAGKDVIYGEDNRVDVYASTNSAFVELSKSTAAMIPAANLKSVFGSRNEFKISAQTLEDRGICAQERFSKQLSAANCSGFLVAPDVLVTAGHCIKDMSDCSKYKWVFDYKLDAEDQESMSVSKENVYGCSKILSRSLDSSSKDDYAVIQLERKTDRAPLSFRREGKVSIGSSLVVIGHPTGLPTKIADGAKVRSYENKFFVANLDTYGGNSGSAVFNVETSEVEGILVRGDNDYKYDANLGCQVSNRCTESGCRGEDVTYITNISVLKEL